MKRIKKTEELKMKLFIKNIAYTKGKFSERKAIRALKDYYILLREHNRLVLWKYLRK